MKTHVLRPAAALIALLAIVRAPLGQQTEAPSPWRLVARGR